MRVRWWTPIVMWALVVVAGSILFTALLGPSALWAQIGGTIATGWVVISISLGVRRRTSPLA